MLGMGFVEKTYAKIGYVYHKRPKVNLFCQSVKPVFSEQKSSFRKYIIDCFNENMLFSVRDISIFWRTFYF